MQPGKQGRGSDDRDDKPPSSVVFFRAVLGVVLAAFAALLAFLIFQGRAPAEPSTALPGLAPALTATALGVEVPPLVVAQEAPQTLPVTPLAEATGSGPLIEVVPVNPDVAATPSSLPANLTGFEAGPLSNATAGKPNPYFGPNYKPNDGKPMYVCAVDAFASYLLLVQMQTSGKDVEHGFHLGIVPYSINDQEYEITQEATDTLMKSGEWDCDLGTLDTVARTDYGVVTAIIDESAGGDGIYARGVSSIYELKGKRLGYVKDVSAELFARYILQIAQLNTSTVSLVPFDDINDAVIAFDQNQIDAISGWDPFLRERAATGGTPLVTTEQLRIILDVVVTSKAAIQNKPQVVQAFHDAWFDTLKVQLENPDYGAALIAAWGHNDWLAISKENPGDDLRTQMQTIAQADLQDNVRLMANPASLYNQIDVARKVWAEAGPLAPVNVQAILDPQFVLAVAGKPELQTAAQPLNSTFSLAAGAAVTSNPPVLAATPTPAQASTSTEATLVVLPCKRFTFLPDSTDLSAESRNVVNLCVLSALQQRPNASLKIMGSAAWPGPAGTYSEAQVQLFAKQRAQAMADYLASQGIDRTRLVVEGVLPPPDHRETLDSVKQAEDRFVEMTLVTTGL